MLGVEEDNDAREAGRTVTGWSEPALDAFNAKIGCGGPCSSFSHSGQLPGNPLPTTPPPLHTHASKRAVSSSSPVLTSTSSSCTMGLNSAEQSSSPASSPSSPS